MTVRGLPQPRSLLRRLYDWCIDAADKPHAMWIMGAVAFAESSFFPVPPDVMLIPMSLARPERAYVMAAWCTVASVARRPARLCHRRAALRLGRRLADPALRLWRQGRGLPRRLCAVGRLDHPAQGADADPLQDRHHHLRLCRLQFRAVRRCFRSLRAARGSSCWPSCCTATASRPAISSRSGSALGDCSVAAVVVDRHRGCAILVLRRIGFLIFATVPGHRWRAPARMPIWHTSDVAALNRP